MKMEGGWLFSQIYQNPLQYSPDYTLGQEARLLYLNPGASKERKVHFTLFRKLVNSQKKVIRFVKNILINKSILLKNNPDFFILLVYNNFHIFAPYRSYKSYGSYSSYKTHRTSYRTYFFKP